MYMDVYFGLDVNVLRIIPLRKEELRSVQLFVERCTRMHAKRGKNVFWHP